MFLLLLPDQRDRRIGGANGGDHSWTENGAEIVPLRRVTRSLERHVGRSIRSQAPAETPVLLAPGARQGDPFEAEVALLRSGLRLRWRAGNLWVDRIEPPVTPGHRTAEAAGRPAIAIERSSVKAEPPASSACREVASGVVAVDGEFLDPPFIVRTATPGEHGAGPVITVNGRRVFPPPILSPEFVAAIEAIDRTIGRGPGAMPASEPDASAPSTGDLAHVTWRSEHHVVIHDARGARLLCPFPDRSEEGARAGDTATDGDGARLPETIAREPQRERPSCHLVAAVARGIELALGGGCAILAGRDYIQVLPDKDVFLRRRIENVCAADEPEALRIARVQAYGVRREAAIELVRSAGLALSR